MMIQSWMNRLVVRAEECARRGRSASHVGARDQSRMGRRGMPCPLYGIHLSSREELGPDQ
jgi:hypothetical protein